MKQRITIKDIETLSDKQRLNLKALWMPEKYDVAVAKICKDITSEDYESYEFVIGGMDISNGYRILLHDIKTENPAPVPEDEDSFSETDNENTCSPLTDDEAYDLESSNTEEYGNSDGNDEEAGLDYSYILPTSFIKDECLPLLNIGQMIAILQSKNFGKSSFYMSVIADEISCELGKDNLAVNSYDKGFEEAELCDVLWESVKALL